MPHGVAQTARHQQQQCIAGLVTAEVVDMLELVEIEEQQGTGSLVAHAQCEDAIEHFPETAAVEQVRQRIVVCQPHQVLLPPRCVP